MKIEIIWGFSFYRGNRFNSGQAASRHGPRGRQRVEVRPAGSTALRAHPRTPEGDSHPQHSAVQHPGGVGQLALIEFPSPFLQRSSAIRWIDEYYFGVFLKDLNSSLSPIGNGREQKMNMYTVQGRNRDRHEFFILEWPFYISYFNDQRTAV